MPKLRQPCAHGYCTYRIQGSNICKDASLLSGKEGRATTFGASEKICSGLVVLKTCPSGKSMFLTKNVAISGGFSSAKRMLRKVCDGVHAIVNARGQVALVVTRSYDTESDLPTTIIHARVTSRTDTYWGSWGLIYLRPSSCERVASHDRGRFPSLRELGWNQVLSHADSGKRRSREVAPEVLLIHGD